MKPIPAAAIHFPPEDRESILRDIAAILESGKLTLGEHTKAFEQAFAAKVGVRHAVAVNSGTSALEIILRALDLGGAGVVVPTNTFFATPAAVLHAGARVLFADADENLALDPRSLEAIPRDAARAVVVVHIGGMVAPGIDAIRTICRDRGWTLLEDAAHAHGSTWNGTAAGRLGRAAAFSFYPTKVITSGEGGMITTDDEALAARARTFRDQGKAGFEQNLHTELGYNWRLSELHAVLGKHQLARLDAFIERRRRIAAIYAREVPGFLAEPAASRSNFYKAILLLPPGRDRKALKAALREKHGVSLSGEVYELPCHRQPVFERLVPRGPVPLGRAEDLCARHVCLPVSAVMTDEDAARVVEAVRKEVQR